MTHPNSLPGAVGHGENPVVGPGFGAGPASDAGTASGQSHVPVRQKGVRVTISPQGTADPKPKDEDAEGAPRPRTKRRRRK